MYHVRALVFFVYGWLSKITCQMAPAPFGLENLLFGGLGAFPPTQSIGMPIGIENLFGQAQYSPNFGMPPNMGPYPMSPYPMGPLPFPLFPMPCDMICEHGGLFFANISISNQQQQQQQARPGAMPGAVGVMPAGMAGGGMPGGGMPGGGMPGGGMPGGGMPGGGMPTTMRPPGAGGAPGAGAGAAMGGGAAAGAGARPGAAGGAGMAPGGAGGMPTTMPTMRPPQTAGQQTPSVNAQLMYFYPNWCTGWCRFFYRPRPMMPPPLPPPPLAPSAPFPHPACLIFSWLGL